MSFQYTSSTSCVTNDAPVPVLTPELVATNDSPAIMVAVQVLLLPLTGAWRTGAMVMSGACWQAACNAAARSCAAP